MRHRSYRARRFTFFLAAALATGFWTFALPGIASPPPPIGATPGDEDAFLAENNAAMERMMADMAVAPTGDVDRDFVAMMVPHHQGAIDMAMALLRFGRNEQLKRLAQEIIVTQQQEIAAMRLAIGEPLPPSVPSPTRPASTSAHGHASQHGTPRIESQQEASK